MANTPQTFANHTRWHAPFHFFVVPVLLINFFWSVILFIKDPNRNTGWSIIVSVALVVLATLVRTNSLKVQDRLIRLEEKLRYQRLISPALCEQASSLAPAQIVALRFAGDDELEALVAAALAGKFSKTGDIKRAIKNWRADTFRV